MKLSLKDVDAMAREMGLCVMPFAPKCYVVAEQWGENGYSNLLSGLTLSECDIYLRGYAQGIAKKEKEAACCMKRDYKEDLQAMIDDLMPRHIEEAIHLIERGETTPQDYAKQLKRPRYSNAKAWSVYLAMLELQLTARGAA